MFQIKSASTIRFCCFGLYTRTRYLVDPSIVWADDGLDAMMRTVHLLLPIQSYSRYRTETPNALNVMQNNRLRPVTASNF